MVARLLVSFFGVSVPSLNGSVEACCAQQAGLKALAGYVAWRGSLLDAVRVTEEEK